MFFVAGIYPKINLRIYVIYMFKVEKFSKTEDLPIGYTKIQD